MLLHDSGGGRKMLMSHHARLFPEYSIHEEDFFRLKKLTFSHLIPLSLPNRPAAKGIGVAGEVNEIPYREGVR